MEAGLIVKRCIRCQKMKTPDEFYSRPSAKDGLESRCKSCMKEVQRERYASNPELHRQYSRTTYKRNRKAVLDAKKVKVQRLKKECVDAYGGKCVCCGIAQLVFLAIDHIEGGGRKHRLALGGGSQQYYRWLKKNGFPEGFQVLCHNCNVAKHLMGKCPHVS